MDAHGESVLTAWWRLVARDGEKVLASGKFSGAHTGPSPDKNPGGAAALMSTLAADLSRELAKAIQVAVPQ